MKKTFWALAVVVVLIAGILASGAAGLLRGAWLDQLASLYLSKRTGLKIGLYNVRISGIAKAMEFRILSVADSSHGRIFFVSGEGEVKLTGRRFTSGGPRRYEIRLKDAVIMEELCSRSALVHWAASQAFDKPIVIQELRFFLRQDGRGIALHLVSCNSDQLNLNGGLLLRDNKISKIHALILLPAEKFEKIPKEMRSRMIRRGFGWRGVRLVYSKGLFTALGQSGPFFQAQWNRGQL